jgi:3-oxoadipate enol-lactonase
MRVPVGDIELHYEQRGSGPDLVLLPGLGAGTHVWWPQLRDLSQSMRVTAVDPRGHGRSSCPPGPYSISMLAADLAGFLEALRIRPAVLVASSMGSLVAVEAAAEYGDMIRGLALVGGFPVLPPEAQERFRQRAVTAETEGMEPLADLVIQSAMGPYTHRTNPGLVGLFRQTLAANNPAAYAASCRAIAEADVTAQLARVHCPTLIVVGEEELVAPLPAARKLKAGIPHADVCVIPNAGHIPFLEQPGAFNSAITQFVAGF